MAKVWLVTEGAYSDYRVIGIYSSEAKAEEAKAIFVTRNDLEEYELDSLPEGRQGFYGYMVSMRRNGDSYSQLWDSPAGFAPGWSEAIGHPGWSEAIGPRGRNTDILREFHVWAKDGKHAVKIANEYRTQMIAEGAWPE
jgi:hypothetical protein